MRILWFATLAGASCALSATAAEPRRPNVVLILTDNHGAWTLGCYGNPDIRTPHIDRLAREGLRFPHSYSSNAVCSPTRATLFTGLLPSQRSRQRTHFPRCRLSWLSPALGW
jgi:arylsulfatase A-like enzyme